jgi:hypothetical protein
MQVDQILDAFNRRGVAYLLIGGANFMLRHAPVLTYDLDLWVEDTEANLDRCAAALADLQAEWGASEEAWGPVAKLPAGWLRRQALYCLTSPHGAIDVFRAVTGLPRWQECSGRAVAASTAAGTPYRGLSDEDMLRSQEALAPKEQKADRIRALRAVLQRRAT